MFYKNKSLLKTSLSLMVNNTDSIPLMNAIYDCFTADFKTKLESIADLELKEMFRTVVDIAEAIRSKGLRTTESARMYVEQSSLEENTKKLILSMKQRISDDLVKDYVYYFSRMTYINKLQETLEDVNIVYDDLEKVGIDKIKNTVDRFIDKSREFGKTVEKVSQSVTDKEFFVVDTTGKDNYSIGMDIVEQSIINTNTNRVKTGTWIDHLTGGGFLNEALYIALAIPGGFKSGFMQNIAEYISMTMDPDKIPVPEGMKPAVYYLNLEMRSHQMLKRRMSFYEENLDEMMIESDNTGTSIGDMVGEVLRKNGSRVPVIYEQSKENTLTIPDIKLKIEDLDRYGFKVIAIIVDYLDLIKYNSTIDDQFEKKIPLVSKAELLRALASEYKVPVITAAQLNREAEDIVTQNAHRLDTEDIVLRLSSAQIAKAHLLKAIPEQMFVCHKFRIEENDYLSVHIEKDRQGEGKYVPSEFDQKSKADRNKGGGEKVMKYNKSRRNKSKVLYVSKLDGLRITNVYSDTIKSFENDVSDTDIFESMEID